MSLSIIIPTIGRNTLRNTLESIMYQIDEHDQVMVIGDGEQSNAEKIVSKFKDVEYHETKFAGCWGHPQRNFGMELATGTHLSFMDDDDEYSAEAIRSIKHVIKLSPTVPIIFQMQYPSGFLLWQSPHLKSGNVGTPMIVVPNNPSKLGVWGNRREGDYDFLESMRWTPQEIAWWPIIIARIGYNDGAKKA